MSSECFNWLELASIQVVGACIGPWRVVRNCVYSRSCMYSKLSSVRHTKGSIKTQLTIPSKLMIEA